MPGFNFAWGSPLLDASAGGYGGITAPEMLTPSIGGYGAGMTAPMTPTLPGATPSLNQSMFGGGLGMNMDTAKLALSGIGTLGSLYGAFQAAGLAKKQFNYTRDVTETNLANQLKTYNTQLTDRANNRAIVEGRTPGETQSYIDRNQLTRYGR